VEFFFVNIHSNTLRKGLKKELERVIDLELSKQADRVVFTFLELDKIQFIFFHSELVGWVD